MKKINDWEIKTDSGWSSFKGVLKKGVERTFRISFNSGKSVTATEAHNFFIKNEKIQVKDIKIGMILDGDGYCTVNKIECIGDNEVYDVIETKNHKFIVNNSVISSNCDEFAFVPENMAEDFWRSNYPTVASNDGKIIIVSTPKGTGGKFYQIYTEAEKGINGFKHIRVPWNRVPGRDEAWKEKTIKELGVIGFAQEHSCSFTGSTTTLISGDVLAALKTLEPVFLIDEGYVLWRKPESKRLYAFGVDVGQGASSDYSVINIFDITDYTITGKYEQVGLYRRNDVGVFDFEKVILKLGKDWNDALVIVENNGTGLGSVLVKELYFEDGYENAYFDAEKGEYGVNSNRKTKALALTFFKSDIEEKRMKIVSKQMGTELSYFEEQKDGIFSARKGNNFHDDTVSSGYWVSYMLRQPWAEERIHWFLEQNGKGKINKKSAELEDEGIADAFISGISGFNAQADFDRELWQEE